MGWSVSHTIDLFRFRFASRAASSCSFLIRSFSTLFVDLPKISSRCFELALVRSLPFVNLRYRWPDLSPVFSRLDTTTLSAKTGLAISCSEFSPARRSLNESWCAIHCLSYFIEQPTPLLSSLNFIFTCSVFPSSLAPSPFPCVQPIFSMILTETLFLSSDHCLPRGSLDHLCFELLSTNRPILLDNRNRTQKWDESPC